MRWTFLGSPGQIGAAYLAPVYVAEDLVSRVETLRATSTCAGLLPAFHALPGCTRVAFSLAEGDRLEPPSRPLCVPKLERVEIASPTPQSLDARDLAAFLDAAFTPGSTAVQVALTGLTLDGDSSAIPGDRFAISHA